jgi:hypothetical protein
MKARQMRRQARKMSRHGVQPMMLITSDDQLPDMIGVLIGRWLWRYRSELAPFHTACLLALAGWLLHATHPGWWPGVLATTMVAAFVLVRLGHRAGLTRPIERLYAAAVVAAAGAWLSAVTAEGLAQRPLSQLLIVGGPLLSVPWWAHRRRRARVRVERTLAAWPQIAESIGLTGSRVMSAVVDAWGWTVRVALRRGHTVADALGKIAAIESALGTCPGAVRVEPDPDRADQFLMRVLHTDPHSRPVPWQAPDIHSITQPIPLGVFEDASPAAVLLLRRHALVGGVVGSGKSGVLNVIIAALVACEDVVVWGIDLKGGMELRPWAPSLGRLATTPEQAIAVLKEAVTELDRRAVESSQTGARVWEPTKSRPALVIVIDEYAELPEAATAYTDSIARRGRAVAVNILAATQRPTQKAMGHGAARWTYASPYAYENAATSTSSSAKACTTPAGTPTPSTHPASSSSPRQNTPAQSAPAPTSSLTTTYRPRHIGTPHTGPYSTRPDHRSPRSPRVQPTTRGPREASGRYCWRHPRRASRFPSSPSSPA